MKNLENHVDTFNNLVFEKRNKEYGAFVIRAEYNMNKIKSTLITGACFLSLVCGLWFFSGGNKAIENSVIEGCQIVDWVNVKMPEPETKEQTKPKTQSAAMAGDQIGRVSRDAQDHPVKDNSNQDKAVNGVVDNPDANGTSKTDTAIAYNPPVNPVVIEDPAKVHQYAEVMPAYIGNMTAFLQSQIVYPEAAIVGGTEGVVYVEFVVDAAGTIGNAKVVKGIGDGCDEEAIRVVRKMPAWKPGMINGKPVNVLFHLPIRFKLR